MLTFKDQFKDAVLKDRKTATRRLWKKRAALNQMASAEKKTVQQAKTRRFDPDYFAHIIVTSVYHQPLREMTRLDCLLEGLPEMTPLEFFSLFLLINAHKLTSPVEDRELLWTEGRTVDGRMVYVVTFRRVEP